MCLKKIEQSKRHIINVFGKSPLLEINVANVAYMYVYYMYTQPTPRLPGRGPT